MERDLDIEELLEEGELASSEEEEGPQNQIPSEPQGDEASVDYEVLQRPVSAKQVIPEGVGGVAGSSRTAGVGVDSNKYLGLSRPVHSGSTLAPSDNAGYDDDDKFDKSSSSSEDSDDEFGPSGRKNRRMPMSMSGSGSGFGGGSGVKNSSTSAEAMVVDSNDVFKSQAAQFQQKRKPNNIWASVIQDEQVSDIFGKVNVEEYDDRHVLIDRGPETFSVKYKTRPPVRRRRDSSELSSAGLSDNELDFLRGDSFQEDEEKNVGKPNREITTKKLRQRRKRKVRMVNKMKKMGRDELGQYMAEKLSEPKRNLIINAIQLLGTNPCIALFLKTTKIERRGGLMIMNQQRRRTPGGVFFYLLRGDTRFPKKLVDRIFEADQKDVRIGKKRERKERMKKKKAELENQIALHKKEDEVKGKCENPVEVDESSDIELESNAMSGDDADSEAFDSDEFCGIKEGNVSEDILDIHCDPSDLM